MPAKGDRSPSTSSSSSSSSSSSDSDSDSSSSSSSSSDSSRDSRDRSRSRTSRRSSRDRSRMDYRKRRQSDDYESSRSRRRYDDDYYRDDSRGHRGDHRRSDNGYHHDDGDRRDLRRDDRDVRRDYYDDSGRGRRSDEYTSSRRGERWDHRDRRDHRHEAGAASRSTASARGDYSRSGYSARTDGHSGARAPSRDLDRRGSGPHAPTRTPSGDHRVRSTGPGSGTQEQYVRRADASLSPPSPVRRDASGGAGPAASNYHRTPVAPPRQPPADVRPSPAVESFRARRAREAAATQAPVAAPPLPPPPPPPPQSDGWISGTIADFTLQNKVGEGTYGEVYKAQRKKTGTMYALKKVRMDHEKEGFPITAVREIKILRQLHHESIVHLGGIASDIGDPPAAAAAASKDGAKDKEGAAFYMIFEYMEHDLTGILEGGQVDLGPNHLRQFMRSLLLGLDYVHKKGMLHRDIKASNLLVNNRGELKIADFGLARSLNIDEERPYTNRVITLWYRPPELLLGNEVYGPEVDMWSTGCILGELYNRRPVFRAENEIDQLDAISRLCGTPTPAAWPTVHQCKLFDTMQFKKVYPRIIKDHFRQKFPDFPPDGVDLLDQLLILDPSKRITSSRALQHPYVREDLCEKVQIAIGQDCHEMWVKKVRKKNAAAAAEKDKKQRAAAAAARAVVEAAKAHRN